MRVFKHDLATGAFQGCLTLWDVTDGNEAVTFRGHSDLVDSVAFSQDGSLLASGAWDNVIKLWDMSCGKEVGQLRGHLNAVTSLAFNASGTVLASGSVDASIKLWDTATGRGLKSLWGHRHPVIGVAFAPDGVRIASLGKFEGIKLWNVKTGEQISSPKAYDVSAVPEWAFNRNSKASADGMFRAILQHNDVRIEHTQSTALDLASRLRVGLLGMSGREVSAPAFTFTDKRPRNVPFPMLHFRQDALAQLASPDLTPEKRAELQMQICAKSGQHRAATAQWQRLLQGEWPGLVGSTVPKDQAPATIPADSPIRRLYLLALIDATKHPQIHGHPTICQTAAQITPVLTKEMMATPTISLAMMSLMQQLAKDGSPDMSVPRAALLQRLEEVAAPEWLEVLRNANLQR